MQLVVGTASTWSLRVWICCQIAAIKVDLVVVPLQQQGYQSQLAKLSSTMLVPVLYDGDIEINDSLAITEYLNELTDGALYPEVQADRAKARSLIAELHSGFLNIRQNCPFSTRPVAPITDTAAIAAELARLHDIFTNAATPFMFDTPGAIDAFYSVMAYRLNAYGIHFDGDAGRYQQALLAWPLLNDAIAHAEQWQQT
ncbi:glutathione S-transferase N-terminal domain-containing protein [Corallincola spongiicola]|uniref:Glutathione S-transferase n=1 Tax=Corallincola spongiicola TaxID=2520508 RepID=A0ABY1WSB0_9GAMM|nr:glutathione S-transferase N-terminal domain-containing protein [Corallincola spongiicola]TAA47463.1 glutathione S-transferase [Corallincola spongiicola]